MIQIGCWHTLVVTSRDDRGATLLLDGQPVLLPKKECPMATQVGDEMTVFVYNGRHDQLMATFKKPSGGSEPVCPDAESVRPISLARSLIGASTRSCWCRLPSNRSG